MLLDILTPEKLLFQGEVKSIKLPGTNGEFEILNNHAPLVSSLSKGEVRIVLDDKEQLFNIDGGVVEVMKNKVVVLAS